MSENAIQRPVRLALTLTAALAFLAPLLTRIVIGYGFYLTGSGKWGNLEGTTQFFSNLGIPFPGANATFISLLEMVGGLLLIIGLLTRLISAGLASTMVVALLTADREEFLQSWSPTSDTSPWDVSPTVLLLFLMWLMFYGPGKASLDHFLARALKLSGPKPAE